MDIIIGIFIFYLGALLTSFAHLIAIRIPEKHSITGHSHCDSCQNNIRFLDVLPLIGYMLTKGRCRICNNKIPIKYPLFELIGGMFFLLFFLVERLTINYFFVAIFLWVMILESLSDIENRLVIDRIWISALLPLISIAIFENTIIDHLISAAFMFAVLFIIAFIANKLSKQEAMGGGDVKLFIFVGFFLYWENALLSLLFASLLGFFYGKIAIRKPNQHIPFVPFIFVGAMIAYLFGKELIDWYVRFLRM